MIEQFTLECLQGRQKGKQYSFPGNATVRVGRKKDCDLPVPEATVSGNHCLLVADGQDIWLRDEGSTNGTAVGDQKVSEVLLRDADTITLGGTCIFRIRIRYGIPAEDEALIHSILKTVEQGSDGSGEKGSGETCCCQLCGKLFPAQERCEGLDICPDCMENHEEEVLHFLLANTPARPEKEVTCPVLLPGDRLSAY